MSRYKNWDGKGRGDDYQVAVAGYGDTVLRQKAAEVHSHDMSDSVAMRFLLDLEERGLPESAHPPGEDLLTLWLTQSKPVNQSSRQRKQHANHECRTHRVSHRLAWP